MAGLLPGALDYTDKDFDSLRVRLQALIRTVFPTWNDYNVANFGNLLLDLYCYVGDVLGFYQDNQARETRITYVTQRKNLLALVKLLEYSPSSASAATADATFSIPAAMPGDVLIPGGRYCRTANVAGVQTVFQLLANTTILAGNLTATGTVENSASYFEAFTSTLRPDQEVSMQKTPYIDHTAIVVAGDGPYFERVNLLDSGPTDHHFTVSVDQLGKATLRFGNGINGSIPLGTINVYFKVGGGKRGNVQAHTIIKLDGTYTDSFGTPVVVSVDNANPASGGADRETMTHVKQNAPASVRVAARTVAREDYEINAKRVAGVARALMLTSNEHPGVGENMGMLFVIPEGGGLPSTALKQAVLDEVSITYPHTLTFHVDVMDPSYLAINIETTVYLRQGYSAATAKAAILDALARFFEITRTDGSPNPNVDFGFNSKDAQGNPAGEVAWSDIFNCIRDVAQVRKVDESSTGLLLNGLRSDVVLGMFDFPTLGTVVIWNGDTGSLL